MATINLLPWREERRRERKRQFFIILGTAAGITLGIIVLVHGLFTQLIEHQQVRNKYIEDQIALLDKKITEIRELEKEKQRLLDRIRAIETLQTSRPVIVHLFDELVTTLPEGVFLTEISQQGDAIAIKGVAQSNARVSSFMRNIEVSPWLKSPHLELVEATAQDGRRLSNFTLKVQQVIQTAKQEDPGGAG
ncbi:MAG TPA: PilN domain-containing protein [Gammaproteobacteria bacterium]|nr:PilN domain-containing protein [Gammaproteobacteria bacterium]